MQNAAAVKFLKQLIAAFCKFPIPDPTKELYAEKLSKWKLTQDQWDAALDILIESHEEEGLPQLTEIYRCLKAATQKVQTESVAWASRYFTSKGYDYVVRLVNKNSSWVYPPSHRYSGMTPVLPPDTINDLTIPDKPPPPQPEQMPSKAEVRELVDQVMQSIKKIA